MKKQLLFLGIISYSVITLAFQPIGNRVLNKGWWNEINGQYLTDVFYNRNNSQDVIGKLPVIIKNRKGRFKLAGTLGEYRSQNSQPTLSDFSPKTNKLLSVVINNYGVVCDDRFLIAYSDQVSDCKKALVEFQNELKETEEGLKHLGNKHQELTEFFATVNNDDNNSNEINQQN